MLKVLLLDIGSSTSSRLSTTKDKPNTSSGDPTAYFVKSSKARVFHIAPKCGSSLCSLVFEPHDLPSHLRPCKRCCPLHMAPNTCAQQVENEPLVNDDFSAKDNSSYFFFQCIDLWETRVYEVQIDETTADISCSCDAFETGDLCIHIRFVLQKVLDADKWLNILYEYGGFDGSHVVDFLLDLKCWVDTLTTRKRRCFACLDYVNGLHSEFDSDIGRLYHKECCAQIKQWKKH